MVLQQFFAFMTPPFFYLMVLVLQRDVPIRRGCSKDFCFSIFFSCTIDAMSL